MKKKIRIMLCMIIVFSFAIGITQCNIAYAKKAKKCEHKNVTISKFNTVYHKLNCKNCGETIYQKHTRNAVKFTTNYKYQNKICYIKKYMMTCKVCKCDYHAEEKIGHSFTKEKKDGKYKCKNCKKYYKK